jgi:hypothetical protein
MGPLIVASTGRARHGGRRLTGGLTAVVLALAGVLWLSAGTPAHAKLWDGGEQKCELTIPDDPAPWDWLPVDSAWSKYGIVVGAERRVKELKDGNKAEGQGGQLHLAIRPAPEGATLDSLAKDSGLNEFLTVRFTKITEKVRVTEGTLNDDLPTRVLRVAGVCNNLAGKEAPCVGVMVLCLAHGKLYLLRMYAWSTEFDAEGVRDDLDWIEVNGLTIVDAKSANPEGEGEGPPPAVTPDEPEEEGVEEKLEFETHNLVLVKHPKVTQVELDRDETRQDVLFKFGANETKGGYNVTLYAFPVVGGQQRANLPNQVGLSFYEEFLNSHSAGDIYVFPWPKKPTTTKEKTFLTLPDLSEGERKVISDAKRKKPDPEASLGDLDKMGVYESPKVKNVGDEFKAPGPTHRAVLGGNLEGVGEHVALKYGWYSNDFDFVLYVWFTREGYMKYGEGVRATIESIRFPKKWEKRWR